MKHHDWWEKQLQNHLDLLGRFYELCGTSLFISKNKKQADIAGLDMLSSTLKKKDISI